MKRFKMNGKLGGSVTARKRGNSQGEINSDGCEIDSEMDTLDRENLQNLLNYVGPDSVAGYDTDTLETSRLTCCCKYHGHRITDRRYTARYKCRTDIVNISVKQLTDSHHNVSTDSTNLNYSNKSETSERERQSAPEPEVVCRSSSGELSSRDIHYRKRRSYFRLNRRTMLKLLFYSVLVCILCLCGGVVMMNFDPDSSTQKDHINKHIKSGIFNRHKGTQQESNVVMDLPYKNVPLELFERHLAETSSVADIMRIFFDKPNLTDDQVNSILYMKSHSTLYGKREFTSRDVMNDEIGDSTGNGEKWMEHIKEYQQSPLSKCSEPKPELVRMEDQEHGSILTYFPSCTIVHRCKSETGCCPYGEQCQPRKENGIEIIDRHFMVLKRSFDEHGKVVTPTRQLFVAKSFVNHTACECKKVEIQTNCNKKCPRQFRKERTRADCDCVCQHANRKCRSIKRGIHPLDESDLECIKKDECIVPQCKSGSFNIATGFCPHYRRHKRQKAG